MTKWEYRIWNWEMSGSDNPQKDIDTMGSEGWELIYILEGNKIISFFFKRPLEEKE